MTDEDEEWRDVDGWPYQVSSHGRVRSVRLIAHHESAYGHARVHMYDRTRTTHRLVHRLVAAAFHGPQPPGKRIVAHRNGVANDNRASNVYWADDHENAADRKRHGRYLSGSSAPNAKLTDDQAVLIRHRYRNGMTNISALSRMFGVSRPIIKNIIDGRSYKSAGDGRHGIE